MTEWHVKDISELTNTSIRMLRHYDKIGLLKPSYRTANGYRCYTQVDLAKLQQIIALKYFGFSLNTIKDILQKHDNAYAHLQAQQQMLKQQSQDLLKVTDKLAEILKHLSPSDTPTNDDLLTLITRYHMSTDIKSKLQNSWAGKQLNAEQFSIYLSFYEKFPDDFAKRDKIIEKINRCEYGDPMGPDGVSVFKFMTNLAKKTRELFSENIKLTSSLLGSIQAGKISELELSPEGCLWMSKAMLAFWIARWESLYEAIKANCKSDPKGSKAKKLATEWNELIKDFYSVGPQTLLLGITIWQELARQQHELQDLKVMPTPQEMIKPYHIKLLFDPEALSWISIAIEVHS